MKGNFRWFYQSKTKGFTLLELIIALAISLILVMVITGLLSNSINIFNRVNSSDKTQYEGRYAIDYILKEVKRAREVYPIGQTNIVPKGNPLGFVIRTKPYSRTDVAHQYIYYYMEGNKLMRQSMTSNTKDMKTNRYSNFGTNVIGTDILDAKGEYDNGLINLSVDIEKDGHHEKYETAVYKGRIEKKD